MREYRSGDRLIASWDDATQTYKKYDTDGTVVEERPFTAEEIAAGEEATTEKAQTVNADSLKSKAKTAQTNNATYLAIASPTNAQVAAQVKALTKQVNALIKLEIHDLADTSGT